MQNLTQPTLLLKPFCQDGDKNQIPVQNDSLVDPQLADLTNGFPEITSKPPSQGGLPPERRDFNALGYLTTSYDWFYQAGGTFTFNQTISDAIGGYPLNARLWYTDSDGISMVLRSTIQNNTNNFLTDSSVIGQIGDTSKPWVIESFMGIKGQYDLLDFKWSDHLLDNQDWLRADTFSWQDGTVYTNAYTHLVADYNGGTSQTETVGSYTITYVLAADGHKIATDETTVANIYNESGVAWYYILDTTNQRFKLPRENPLKEEIVNLIQAPVKGTGKSLGMTNGVDYGGVAGVNQGQYGNLVGKTDLYNANVSNGAQVNANRLMGTLGVTTDASMSGLVTVLSSSTSSSFYKGKKYLYFYVGQFSQTATEQTAGLNSELFNGKVDLDGSNATFKHIVETYSSGTSWYRLWSDGWCEQGGIYDNGSSIQTTSVRVNLLKTFANTNYIVLVTPSRGTIVNSSTSIMFGTHSLTVSYFYITWLGVNSADNVQFAPWYACGYVS